jgi:hypothetical protein
MMHVPVVSLPHKADAIGKKQGRHKWASCQSPNHHSSEVHEMDRDRSEGLKTVGFVPMIQKNRSVAILRPLCIAGAGVLVGVVLGLMIAHTRAFAWQGHIPAGSFELRSLMAAARSRE